MDAQPIPTPAVVPSILEDDAGAAGRRLSELPPDCAIAEIRGDRLRPDEIAALVRRATVPVIVTVRAPRDGGAFEGSEEERGRSLDAALAAGARFVDVEWDGPQAHRASGPGASRTVLSHHGARCRVDVLRPLFRDMAATAAPLLKIVPRAASPAEIDAVRDLLGESRAAARPLACFALGGAGVASRIFAPSWGSWGTYGAAHPSKATADGQPAAEDLLGLWNVLRIGASTRRFALAGAPIATSPSPAMHAAAFRYCGMDAVYVPVETARVEEVLPLVGSDGILGIEGLGVTIPLKGSMAALAVPQDAYTASSGAANTVATGSRPWRAWNTDAPAALALVRAVLDPAGARVAMAGAGATARSIGAALRAAGGRVVFHNRDEPRAREAAARLGASWAPWDRLGRDPWDVLVQATPLGREGEEVVPPGCLTGSMVLDVAYGDSATPLVREAARRGLAVADGLRLLVAQAALQFRILTGRDVPVPVFEAAAFAWLGRRRLDGAGPEAYSRRP